MSKGDDTRHAILAKAFELATVVGVSGLSIGRLAEEMRLSKSGLFAHFGSKEALEVAVVEEAARQFIAEVMVPALRVPRGEPRLRAMFGNWLVWGDRPGGCFFFGVSAELDDRPGPARDALVRAQKDWVDEIAKAARIAVSEGHFDKDVDADQFAFELYSLMLGYHLFARFLREPDSRERTIQTFERLIASARSGRPVLAPRTR